MSVRCRYWSSRRRWPTSISSPRREWWSFLCSRRCSVRWLMRAVSRATWTSVDPVSLSPLPWRATISCFCSTVSVMRRAKLAALHLAGCGTDLAGLIHVAAHLGDQVVDRLEPLLAPQPLQEGDTQRLAVQITVEIQQVGLDQQPAAGLERGPHADVDRGRVAVGPARVDAVPGDGQPVVGDEVRGRHAERAA